MILRGEPDVSRSLDRLHERLKETIAWCGPRADAARARECLRTPELAARPLEPDYFAAVGTVASRRRAVLSHRFIPPRDAGQGGRLLVYFPDADLSDGAAEVESEGFFDVWNCPPWDTWVGIFRDERGAGDAYATYLVAWVPPGLVELAQRGIEVNPEECIRWLEDASCDLRRRLDSPSAAPGLLSTGSSAAGESSFTQKAEERRSVSSASSYRPGRHCHSERGAAPNPADSTAAGAPTEESGGWARCRLGHDGSARGAVPLDRPHRFRARFFGRRSCIRAKGWRAGASLRMTVRPPRGVLRMRLAMKLSGPSAARRRSRHTRSPRR
jgi:hypothetical protein